VTPAELYARKPERVDHIVGVLGGFYYNHMPEIDDGYMPYEDPNKRIAIRYYKDFDFDGRRFWRLAAVCFDGLPFMIIQNAGREGDDHHRRFITDLHQYKDAVKYVLSIAKIPDRHETEKDGYFERYHY
jgi:hypothetical protein